MDSDSPLAFGIAGRQRLDTGSQFTSNARTSESEFGFGRRGDGRRRPPGSYPHRRSADGHGR